MKVTSAQIIKFNTLLNKLSLGEEEKRDLIYSWTNSRTDSTKKMLFYELRDLIKHLSKLVPTDDKGDRMRKKIISICYQLGWVKGNKVDMDRVNKFVAKYPLQGLKKNITCLNDYTIDELPKVVSQFEIVLRKYLNTL